MNVNPAVKPADLNEAEQVIMDALDTIRNRLKEHGHTHRSFTMIAEMWTVYVKHVITIRGEPELKAHDVAQMMVLLKNVRSVYGFSHDNFVDEAGYSAISALLQKEPIEPKSEKPKDDTKLPKVTPLEVKAKDKDKE